MTTPTTDLTHADTVALLKRVAQRFAQGGLTKEAAQFEQLALERENAVTDDQKTAASENFRVQVLDWEAKVKYHNDWKLESLKATMALAQRALTSAILINGGAAVALLSYLASSKAALDLRHSLLCFGAGVFLAGVAFGASYFAQSEYSDAAEDSRDASPIWHRVAIALGLSSFLTFGGGIVSTYMAFPTETISASGGDTRNRPPPKAPPPPPVAPAPPVAPQKK